MCRKNIFFAGVLISFGAGLLLGIFFESTIFPFLLGVGSIVGALCLLHK